MNFGRLFLLSVVPVALSALSYANTIVFNDLTESPSVSINGTLITGNGGLISNYSSTFGGEVISFDIFAPGVNLFTTFPIYRDLLDQGYRDDQ